MTNLALAAGQSQTETWSYPLAVTAGKSPFYLSGEPGVSKVPADRYRRRPREWLLANS